MLHDGDPQAGGRSGTASRRCCTRSRSPASTARASTTTGRWPPTPGSTCSTRRTRPTPTCSSWCSSCAVIRAVDLHADLLRASIASAAERPPAGRQRGAAGDHLDLPGRHARRTSWSRWRRACPSAPSGAARSTWAPGRCRSCPRHSGDRNRTSPVRLHREQVRVPRGGLERRASPGPTRCSTPSWPSRSTTWRPSWRRRLGAKPVAGQAAGRGARGAQEGDQAAQAGASSTATTTPRSGTRRRRSAGCRIMRDSVEAFPVLQAEEERRPVQEVRRAQQGRAASRGSTSRSRST